MKKTLSMLLAAVLAVSALSGCGKETPAAETTGPAAAEDPGVEIAEPVKVDFSKTDADMFTDRDRRTDYNENNAIAIQLEETKVSASDGSVKISGTTVTVTEEGTYVISGTLTDGMLVVDAPESAKLQLVFKGVQITSQTAAALYIRQADKVFLTLAEGTENTLANGGSFTPVDESNMDAALFSRQDLTMNGAGALTVTSPAGHGITCKDDLVITGGSYTVTAASHGLDANDSVRITDAALTVDAGKDAIHAENDEDPAKGFVYMSGGTVTGEAEGDGIAAGSYLQITGGTVDLLVGGGSENGSKKQSDFYGGFGGGRPGGGWGGPGGGWGQQSTGTEDAGTSMKGLKAENSLLISDGNITINSADDGIHSNVSVIINGGTFQIASGDDGIHAEDTLTITAGQIAISQSYEGLEALHVDVRGGNIKLNASDDGLNAAGGVDQSGTTGGRDGQFGGRPGGGWGGPGGMSGNSNGSIKVSGGSLYVRSSGDAMDANGTLEITGGNITLTGPTQGDTAVLDYDKTATITGGSFIGTGSTMMAQGFTEATQGVIALRVGNQPAGTQILVQDAQGNTVISHTPELDFGLMILSCPELQKGETYSVTIGTQTSQYQAS